MHRSVSPHYRWPLACWHALLLACCDEPAPAATRAAAAVSGLAATAQSALVASPSSLPSAPLPSRAAPAAAAFGLEAGPPSPAEPALSAVVQRAQPAPVGGNWLRCYAHFQPRTQPRLDAMRLGLMCGPSNGMRKVAAVESEVAEGGAGREHRWQARAGDCFRIFVVAHPSVEDLDVRVFDPNRRQVAFDISDDRWPIVKPDGPFCVFDPGEYRAVVRAQRGGGCYAIEIWRLR
jgi:hypothetical protein